jgi:hypothetical protein
MQPSEGRALSKLGLIWENVLVDLKGELIGVNTAIVGPSGANVGIGLAIPSVMVKAVLDQIVRSDEVRRGRQPASRMIGIHLITSGKSGRRSRRRQSELYMRSSIRQTLRRS